MKRDFVFRRNWGERLPRISHGSGPYLHSADGRTYLDAVGGIYVVNLGYGVASIAEAMAKQAREIAFVYGGNFETDAENDLAAAIIDLAPAGFEKVYFTSGGSEANEVAFKIARKYQMLGGQAERWRILGRWQSYHGATMATLSAGGKVSRRREYRPYMLDFPRVTPPDPYRCPEGLSLQAYGRQCADEVERRILQEDPASLAAVIVEPITGAGSGAIAPPPGYMERLREICDRFDLLLIADEVITGFGRTGKPFASQHFDMVPDIIPFGKGVSSGYAPLGGVVIHQRVIDRFDKSAATGVFTGYTYSGHAVSCAAGLEVMRVLKANRLVDKVAGDGDDLLAAAKDRLKQPIVGDVRGKGLLLAVEFVADSKKKQPFPTSTRIQQKVVAAALKRDILVRGETGAFDGELGDHILLAPPFICEKPVLSDMLDRLADAIDEVSKARR
ncbi:MAG: aspartate aminotransferase family protein [Rhodospirillaceae bacterium]|nr:MAG: aspartate aminotransferase family protein [Rhodospirillaceae bacterium]